MCMQQGNCYHTHGNNDQHSHIRQSQHLNQVTTTTSIVQNKVGPLLSCMPLKSIKNECERSESKTLIEALPEVKFKLISMHACMHEHRLMTVMAMQSCLTYTDRRSFHSTTDSLATLLVNTLTLAAIYSCS